MVTSRECVREAAAVHGRDWHNDHGSIFDEDEFSKFLLRISDDMDEGSSIF